MTAEELRAFHRSLPRGIRLVHSIVRFDSDILNGGIQQYVTNHTRLPLGPHAGDEVHEDLEALRTIGANESAKILRQAIAIYEKYGWPSDSETRWLDLSSKDEAKCEKLDALRCNDKASGRDFRLLEDHLWQHLDECVCKVEVKSEMLAIHLRKSANR